MSRFDESLIFVDPDIYLERGNKQVIDLHGFLKNANSEDAVVFVGPDQSGRSVIAKKIQELLTQEALPSILLNAKEIKNSDIISIVRRAMRFQLGSVDFPLQRIGVIIDDFDECNLPDKIKESIIERLNKETRQTIIVSFSNAPCVLFTSRSLPDPKVFNIQPFTDDKLFILVKKWKSIGIKNEQEVVEQDILTAYSQLQMVFSQTEAPKSPCIAIMYLQLLETSSGADIAFSSYSACYDSMINNRLHAHGVDWRAIDECKNFLSLIAYSSYSKTKSSLIDRETYDDCLAIFEEQYLSDPKTLKAATLPVFFRETDGRLSFIEDYLWFFLCARYVALVLRANEAGKYREFVTECTKNIFEKKFANIVIFIAYFSSDNFVLESLIGVLDGLFSKADDWLLSDDTREIMLGFRPADHLQIESKADVEQNRLSILREKISDIVDNAVKVVALYTLPFLKSDVADSVYVETVDVYSIDSESYMRNVNALLRIHSVMGQILTGRSGTYSTSLVLDAISRMVKASGRYASLNHAIATVLIYDQDQSKTEIGRALRKEIVSDEQYEKVLRIFSFWSVYLSHAGLARYLSQAHSIRALQKLASQYETEDHASENGNIPFNFTVVLMIAQLYEKGSVDKKAIQDALQKYGEHSSLFGILRVVFHIYTYYMPMKIEDKQWLSNKLCMSLSKLEIQRLKASDTKRFPRR